MGAIVGTGGGRGGDTPHAHADRLVLASARAMLMGVLALYSQSMLQCGV